MDQERTALYDRREKEIGNTSLYLISRIEIPNGNQVFVKEENMNPGGSHYDRVFVKLFKYFEETGKIIPGYTPVVETTSGSAGVSFARLGKLLGYECLVICPEDLPEGRLRAIKDQGADIRLTPKEKYVDGSAEELGRIFKVENKQRIKEGNVPYFGLNHTQGEAAQIAADAVECAVDEAVKQAEEYGANFDLCVAVGGNGTTLLGFGRGAKRYKFPLVLWESLGSGFYFDRLHGEGSFRAEFGVEPGIRHRLFGTIYGPTPYPLPNIDKALEDGLVEDVVVIGDSDTRGRSLNRITSAPVGHVGTFDLTSKVFGQAVAVQNIPTWEETSHLLNVVEDKQVGRSSAGNIAAILHLIQRRDLRNSNILTFFYDDLSRY